MLHPMAVPAFATRGGSITASCVPAAHLSDTLQLTSCESAYTPWEYFDVVMESAVWVCVIKKGKLLYYQWS